MAWAFAPAYNTFDQYRDMWDGINRCQGNHVLLDSLFVGLLLRYFASPETLLGISQDVNNPGMVIVERVRSGYWQTFQPSQGPLGLIVLQNPEKTGEQIQALIHSLPGYALGFAVLQQDPLITPFRELKQSGRSEAVEYIKTARVPVRGTFHDYWTLRSRNLVHNISRQRRRLAEQGIRGELVLERDPHCVAKCVEEYGRLEGTGWKAREGTAVTTDNQQGLFYREMLESFCRVRRLFTGL